MEKLINLPYQGPPITMKILLNVAEYLGDDNIRWFGHIRGLKGSVNCTLKLNFKKKHLPAHPINLREGMQIRNFLRSLPDCKSWSYQDLQAAWVEVLNQLIDQLKSENETI